MFRKPVSFRAGQRSSAARPQRASSFIMDTGLASCQGQKYAAAGVCSAIAALRSASLPWVISNFAVTAEHKPVARTTNAAVGATSFSVSYGRGGKTPGRRHRLARFAKPEGRSGGGIALASRVVFISPRTRSVPAPFARGRWRRRLESAGLPWRCLGYPLRSPGITIRWIFDFKTYITEIYSEPVAGMRGL